MLSLNPHPLPSRHKLMLHSPEEEPQLIQVIQQILPELSLLDNRRIVDLNFLVLNLPLNFNLPLVGASPVLELFVLFG